MKRAIAAAVLFLAVGFTAAHSSTLELSKAAMKTIDFNSKSVPPERRKAMAAAQLAYWQSFSDRIPRPSPAEVEWLNREMSAGGARLGRLIGSRELALYSLSNTAETCVDTYSALVKAVGTNAKYEAYLWVKTLNCYSSRSDISTYLSNANLSGFDIDMLSLWESHIINRVIETILMRE